MSKLAWAFAALVFARSSRPLRSPIHPPEEFNDLLNLDDRLLDDIGLTSEDVSAMAQKNRLA